MTFPSADLMLTLCLACWSTSSCELTGFRNSRKFIEFPSISDDVHESKVRLIVFSLIVFFISWVCLLRGPNEVVADECPEDLNRMRTFDYIDQT